MKSQNEATVQTETKEPVVAKNPDHVKKAIALAKDMKKQGEEVTKADIARKMYELIHEEPREIIIEAFVGGAGLTPKGAQT